MLFMSYARTGATAVAGLSSTQPKHGIIRLVNRVRVELMDALDRELAQFDISAAQLIVLASVANKEADCASGSARTSPTTPAR
jgi:hypothetical protein